jgi:hypothetical protein
MLHKNARLLVLASLAGCSGTFTPKPGQFETVNLIWHDYYRQDGPPPLVEWVDAPSLWRNVTGFTIIGSRVIVAAEDAVICGQVCDPQLYKFSATSLAHEFMHYRTWQRTGDVDPQHFRGDWALADNEVVRLLERREFTTQDR